ncbi:MAG: Gfo/Idh/MocA family protein [Myxococcales bacterium]
MKPRVGFLGVGWIGRHRMECIARSGVAEIAAIVDPVQENARAALQAAPGARVLPGFAALLEAGLEGVVIATPSAQHAEQSIAALRRGLAVFCQKPLGRDAAEVRAVLDAARAADRLLGVDLSYRFTAAMAEIRRRMPELGEIYGANLVFHNAYGPDKPWFYDPKLSGGGCVMDLGIHLVDLCLWALDFPRVDTVASTLLAGGKPLRRGEACEDYGAAQLRLEGGAVVQLACSWKLPAGQDCVIEASFYGTRGGASLRNVGGSFYDFEAFAYRGTSRDLIARPPDAWGGRAAVAWAEQLARQRSFDAASEHLEKTARALDLIYQAS